MGQSTIAGSAALEISRSSAEGKTMIRRIVFLLAILVSAALVRGDEGHALRPAGFDEPPPSEMIAGHPALSRLPRHTTTSKGRQGDAVNVALVGTEDQLHQTLARAGWYAADPITFQTSLRIAADVVLRKPYAHAPVSDLYLWGRKHDAAFEQPVGNSPKQRHHVRFWRSAEVDQLGKPLWVGAATYDERVEISRATLGVTHKIAPTIDRERNKIVTDAIRAGMLDGYYWVNDFHRQPDGRNGGGDPYFTDRRLAIGVIGVAR